MIEVVEFEGAIVPANPDWISQPLRLPASRVLSMNDRRPRKQVAPLTAAIRRDAMLIARASGPKHFDRAEVKVIMRMPDGRRRDPNNYHQTTKAIIDGLVDAGMFPDDDSAHVLGPDIRASRVRSKPSLTSPMFDFIVLVYEA